VFRFPPMTPDVGFSVGHTFSVPTDAVGGSASAVRSRARSSRTRSACLDALFALGLPRCLQLVGRHGVAQHGIVELAGVARVGGVEDRPGSVASRILPTPQATSAPHAGTG
jgi:hypothetical protein